MDLVNLLAFVQVAVVFNFGLFFLKRQNTYSDVKEEFLRYLNAFKDGYSQNAKSIIDAPIDNESTELAIEKEYVKTYYNRIRFLTLDEDKDYLMLPCMGLFSGFYSLLFLFIVGIEGWTYADKATNLLMLMSQLVLVMDIASYLYLRDKEEERWVRRAIMRLVIIFFLLGITVFLMSCFDWSFHVISCPKTFLALSSIVVVYFPALLLVGTTFKIIHKFLYNQLMCNFHVWRYRRISEHNVTVESQES